MLTKVSNKYICCYKPIKIRIRNNKICTSNAWWSFAVKVNVEQWAFFCLSTYITNYSLIKCSLNFVKVRVNESEVMTCSSTRPENLSYVSISGDILLKEVLFPPPVIIWWVMNDLTVRLIFIILFPASSSNDQTARQIWGWSHVKGARCIGRQ